ncbi:MAG: bacillithiol biosynthesis cysteine-adding enzyme BshC [Salibacteraceae bacterium]
MSNSKSTSISYSEVGLLSKLTRDYLDDKSNVSSLFNLKSSAENIPQVINERQFSASKREVLVEVLKEQYGNLKSKKVFKNIEFLLHENTFTITTGHQLNLFTGPLYFIYKIVSAIKTAEELNVKYPENTFVPVYWMATEDHDFEEINHTYINGKKVQWNSNQTGMVGEFSLDGIEEAISQFCSELGDSIASNELRRIIEKAYLGSSNLAEATRVLVHELFHSYGLVIIDGNHSKLKKLFVPVIEKELFERASFKSVNETVALFDELHKVQVNPREINLFYVITGVRERIIFEDGRFLVNNTEISFSRSEIEKEITDYPERFSPNVILRPVYQETILPNLVYIGGGAEVAYWLELKSTFDSFNVSYPLVQIRSSFLTLTGKSLARIEKLGLKLKDIYRNKEEIISEHVRLVNPFNEKMDVLLTNLKSEMSNISQELMDFDSQLSQSIGVADNAIEKSITRLRKKVNSSVKRDDEDFLNAINELYREVYPNGVYQERILNFFEFHVKFGNPYIDCIFKETVPFCRNFKVLSQ